MFKGKDMLQLSFCNGIMTEFTGAGVISFITANVWDASD